MGRMGDFQCTGLFASASKKGFHARLICASLQRREYAPLFPTPTFCFALEEKMGYSHTGHTWHTDSKVVEMVLVEALRSSRLVTVFPSGDIGSGGPSWAALSRSVQNPDQINVYSLGHCVIPPPPRYFHCGWLTSKSGTDGALRQRDKAEQSEYRASGDEGLLFYKYILETEVPYLSYRFLFI